MARWPGLRVPGADLGNHVCRQRHGGLENANRIVSRRQLGDPVDAAIVRFARSFGLEHHPPGDGSPQRGDEHAGEGFALLVDYRAGDEPCFQRRSVMAAGRSVSGTSATCGGKAFPA